MSATGFHALDAARRGWALTDPALAEPLAPVVREFNEVVGALRPGSDLLGQLKAYCATIESNAQLAEVALVKVAGLDQFPESVAEQLVRAIDRLEAVTRAAFSGGVDQLALRGEPLKAQWEARGPGMLSEIGRITDHSLVAPRADVVLVQPVLGGHGEAHLAVNSAWIEAVLTDSRAELPEVVRLGWLLAQLNCEIPIFGERVTGGRLPQIAALAMLPPALAAAEMVELSHLDEATLAAALEFWRLGEEVAADVPALASTLLDWWSTYTTTRPHWSVALAALAQMAPAV